MQRILGRPRSLEMSRDVQRCLGMSRDVKSLQLQWHSAHHVGQELERMGTDKEHVELEHTAQQLDLIGIMSSCPRFTTFTTKPTCCIPLE